MDNAIKKELAHQARIIATALGVMADLLALDDEQAPGPLDRIRLEIQNATDVTFNQKINWIKELRDTGLLTSLAECKLWVELTMHYAGLLPVSGIGNSGGFSKCDLTFSGPGYGVIVKASPSVPRSLWHKEGILESTEDMKEDPVWTVRFAEEIPEAGGDQKRWIFHPGFLMPASWGVPHQAFTFEEGIPRIVDHL